MSDETGGIAVVGRNDLQKAYGHIVSDNSTCYVLAYYPTTITVEPLAHLGHEEIASRQVPFTVTEAGNRDSPTSRRYP